MAEIPKFESEDAERDFWAKHESTDFLEGAEEITLEYAGKRVCLICHQPYEEGRELTCSDDCHQELVKRLTAKFGEFKKVIRQSTGVAYKVPTRDIIDRGLREQDLDQYPLWEE